VAPFPYIVGHGICVYPTSALLEQNNVESISSKPIDELIKADCFAKAFQGRTFAEYMFIHVFIISV
jgi:hypothetical protein